MNRCISLLFPCYSLFRILPFRQMSLFILTFLQILAVAPPPLQGFTGGEPWHPLWGAPLGANTDNGLSNLLWHEADVSVTERRIMLHRKLVAIVTGAAHGIGLAIAQRLLREGWRIGAWPNEPKPDQGFRSGKWRLAAASQ